jgi:hypothetical protein
MLTFSASLQAALALVADKTQWGAKLNELLGNNRRVRCFRDSDANAANAFLTGIEWLNVGNTGPILTQGGMITSFGTLRNIVTRMAVDLNTGASILRIEGNGHWVQGKLGPVSVNRDTNPDNDVDFTLNGNPTAAVGYAMNATMRPPRYMPTGTGPLAPPADDKRPVVIELVNCKDEKNPVVVGSLTLNVRDDDMVFELPKLAAEMGDIRITSSNESIIYDDFEFGAKLFSTTPTINSESNEVMHELLVSCKPYNRWPTYPAMDTYNDIVLKNIVKPTKTGSYSTSLQAELPGAIADKITVVAIDATTFRVTSQVRGALPDAKVGVAYYGGANVTTVEKAPFYFKLTEPVIKTTGTDGVAVETADPFVVGDTMSFEIGKTFDATKPTDVTTPPPFKVNIRRLDNTIIGVIQMHDGLAINSPKLNQVRQPFEGLRPKWNCGMMLPWRSHRPKMNSKAYDFSPKPVEDSIRNTASQQPSSFNGSCPILNGYAGNINSQNHYYAAPKWSLGWENSPLNDALDPMNDPFVFDPRTYYTSNTGVNKLLARAIGWAYEPGSISSHDWHTGPGGPRIDRCVMASPIALYLWKPNGVRIKDGSTYQENVDAWTLAYFNHSCHYVRNVKTFDSIPTDELMAGKWSYSRAYYGGSDNYVPGGLTRHIAQWAMGNGSSYLKKDRNGQPIWNGWGMDMLHAYGCPGWAALLFNSPMFVVAQKYRFHAVWLAQFLGVNPALTSGFLERNGAWRWLSFAMSWALGTKHPLGISQAVVEDRWRIDMENIHRMFVVPTLDPTHPEYNLPERATLRGLGIMSNSKPSIKKASDYMPPVEDTGEDAEPGDLVPAPGNVHGYAINSNGLTWYISHVFLLMKTTGSFDRMYNMNQKCKETLDFMIRCLDKFCIEFMLDAQGRAEGGYPFLSRPVPTSEPVVFPPTSWAEWATDHFPRKGLEDWGHNEAGEPIRERDIGQHNRALWTHVRKHFYPEFPHPRLDEALAKYQSFYDARKAIVAERIATNQSAFTIKNGDWNYRVPGFHFPTPPTAA